MLAELTWTAIVAVGAALFTLSFPDLVKSWRDLAIHRLTFGILKKPKE